MLLSSLEVEVSSLVDTACPLRAADLPPQPDSSAVSSSAEQAASLSTSGLEAEAEKKVKQRWLPALAPGVTGGVLKGPLDPHRSPSYRLPMSHLV